MAKNLVQKQGMVHGPMLSILGVYGSRVWIEILSQGIKRGKKTTRNPWKMIGLVKFVQA